MQRWRPRLHESSRSEKSRLVEANPSQHLPQPCRTDVAGYEDTRKTPRASQNASVLVRRTRTWQELGTAQSIAGLHGSRRTLRRRASKMNGGGRANKELFVRLENMEQCVGCSHASWIVIKLSMYLFPFLDFFFFFFLSFVCRIS